jgi:hypothetical protein
VGELTKKLSITVHAASTSAREKVEAAGGTLTLLKEPKVKKTKKHRVSAATKTEAAAEEAEAAEVAAEAKSESEAPPAEAEPESDE